MIEEMESMGTNHVWDLVDLPPSQKRIENKWVLKIKRRSLQLNGTKLVLLLRCIHNERALIMK